MNRAIHIFSTVAASLLLLFAIACSGGGKDADLNAKIEDLKKADKATRENACIDLAMLGPKAAPAVPAIIPVLQDKDPETRRLAAYALMEIGPDAKAALPELKKLLADSDQAVVMQAMNSIRAIDPTATDLRPPPNVTQ